jgi:hypothetical protein
VNGRVGCQVVAICSAFFAGAGICWLWRRAKEFMRRIWSAQLPNRDMLPAWMTKVDQVKAHADRFFRGVTKLRVGQISPPIRMRLGFHIVQLTDSKPAQQLPFDQARAEISATLESEKRQGAIKTLIVDLCARAECFSATRR